MKPLWDDERIHQWINRQKAPRQYVSQQLGTTFLGLGQPYIQPPTWADVDDAMKMVRDDYEAKLHTIDQKLDGILELLKK